MDTGPRTEEAMAWGQRAPGSTDLGPEEVVEAQLEASNRRDADALAQMYASDAVIVMANACEPSLVGRNAIQQRYAAMFEAGFALHVTVEARLLANAIVVDREHVQPLNSRSISVYEVSQGYIQRAWLFAPARV